MRDVSMNPTTGRILEAYDAKATGNQKAGIAAYGGKLGGVAKFFGFAVDVKIGDKTVTVNKKSLEKYISRHGGDFHYNKQTAQQLGDMIKKVAPNWERDSVIKQLARTEDINAKDGGPHGGMQLKSADANKFLSALKDCGIEIPHGLENDLKDVKQEFVQIKKEFVDQLRASAKKIMEDEGIGQSKWATDAQKAHAARTSGMPSKPSEPVTKKNLAEKIKELRLPKGGSPLEKCQAFFGNEGFKEIIEFAKTDKASAKILMKELFGNNKVDSKTVKDGIEWVMRENRSAHDSLAELIATAQGK